MSGCPTEDINMHVYETNVVVNWQEPTFNDNVGVTRVIKPDRKPGSVWTAGEARYIQYRALDAAGNAATCRFRVTIKSKYGFKGFLYRYWILCE